METRLGEVKCVLAKGRTADLRRESKLGVAANPEATCATRIRRMSEYQVKRDMEAHTGMAIAWDASNAGHVLQSVSQCHGGRDLDIYAVCVIERCSQRKRFPTGFVHGMVP